MGCSCMDCFISDIIMADFESYGLYSYSLILEYAPIFGAVYISVWAMHKLDTAVSEIDELKKFAKENVGEINNVKINCVKNHK